MSVHISEAMVDPQRRVVLDRLPFKPGEKVDVVIRSHAALPTEHTNLRDSVLRYDDPYEPVALDDWETRR